jgi:membrane protein implicated in regulation of membrane protease activity
MTEQVEERSGVRRFVFENSLSLVFFAIFAAALIGQAIAGHSLYNQDQLTHGEQPISLWGYLSTSHFGNGVMENWQSEYLQFALFALLTVWLVQKGSPESKELGKSGTESDKEQKVGRHATKDSPRLARMGGLPTALYSNSLIIVMSLIFIGSWFAQSVTGWTEFNAEQSIHGEAVVSWWGYVTSSTFWEATLQNWQSEFLAVGSFAVLAIYLRQRGSPESKPVGAPTRDATGQEG